MKDVYEFRMEVRVHDVRALYRAALRVSRKTPGIDLKQSVAMLRDEDGAKVEDCIQMIMDPGESPPGLSIEQSACESLESIYGPMDRLP